MQQEFADKVLTVDRLLFTGQNFDILHRDLTVANRSASLFCIDGMTKDDVYEKMLEFLLKLKENDLSEITDAKEFAQKLLPYTEAEAVNDADSAVSAVLSGQSVLIIEGIDGFLTVDTRRYPARQIEEPKKDRSLKGAKDGFVETLVFNTALIRRRIRDRHLRMEHYTVGKTTKLDVVVCFLDGKADKNAAAKLRKRLCEIDPQSISMTSEALTELLVPSKFINPFPKVRLTERPDFAAAAINEGKILLIMDNSPSIMIFPNTLADFTKETDDYYFSPISASYVRVIRFIVSLLTVYLTPVILVFLDHPDIIPPWLEFINTKANYMLPFFVQFLLLELLVDGLRLASLNTPDALSNSLGIIGSLVLSEFAVEAEWFVPESIIYMAFVSITSYAQPSFELGYAMKFCRVALLVLAELFGFYGIGLGTVIIIMLLYDSKTLTGKSYLYPFVPFNAHDLKGLFKRSGISYCEPKH